MNMKYSTRRSTFLLRLSGRIMLVTLVSLMSVSCGHKTTRGSPEPSATTTTKTQARQFNLDDVLKQVDAVQRPTGVDPARFEAVKNEVKRLFRARSDGKKVSVVPSGEKNKVTDLQAEANGAGTSASITWTEVLWGDYDNSGRVTPADLVPVATYYGQNVNTGADDPHKLVNGDDNPEINVGDLPAIVDDYDAHIDNYQVWRCDDANGVYALSSGSGLTLWSRTDIQTGGAWCTPAIGGDGTVYFATNYDGYLYALYPNGTLKWQWPQAGPPSNDALSPRLQ